MAADRRLRVGVDTDTYRRCDICDVPIPHGTPYRVGHTTPAAVAMWCQDDARFVPSFSQEPDGTIRFDLCARCADDAPGLLACSQPVVEALH